VTAVKKPAADRASAYGLESILIDGNDADVMYSYATTAIEKARDGGGPSLIEALTYRHGGHSRADPGKYRPDEEVAKWKDYDPVKIYRERILKAGIEESLLEEMESATAARVDEATETASNSPAPPLEIAYTDVWADGGVSWRN
jgi:TPP-dependent pyruvate/acetoin dehydrogenase alpha subunit